MTDKPILFFDVETTGKLDFRLPPEHSRQPRVVQLAALLCGCDGGEAAKVSVLIRPDGWAIPPEASAIHGQTTERCAALGVPLVQAVELLDVLSGCAGLIVAHNIDFDHAMMTGECRRLGRGEFAPEAVRHCTMKAGTPVCRLPGRFGDFKWPSLRELHRHLFGEGFDGAHDALADVLACKRCYFEMAARQAEKEALALPS